MGFFKMLGNIAWFIFTGLWLGLAWFIVGLLCCITIIGIPIGRQCFKFAALSFFPFGKDVEFGSHPVSLLLNILWLVLCGIPLALFFATFGLILCVTIIGFPFGLQCFKQVKLALLPFGAKIISRS